MSAKAYSNIPRQPRGRIESLSAERRSSQHMPVKDADRHSKFQKASFPTHSPSSTVLIDPPKRPFTARSPCGGSAPNSLPCAGWLTGELLSSLGQLGSLALGRDLKFIIPLYSRLESSERPWIDHRWTLSSPTHVRFLHAQAIPDLWPCYVISNLPSSQPIAFDRRMQRSGKRCNPYPLWFSVIFIALVSFLFAEFYPNAHPPDIAQKPAACESFRRAYEIAEKQNASLVFTVGKDECADFRSLQTAVDAVPDYSPERTLLFLDSGTFRL